MNELKGSHKTEYILVYSCTWYVHDMHNDSTSHSEIFYVISREIGTRSKIGSVMEIFRKGSQPKLFLLNT